MVKELDDYLDIINEKYPHISRQELKKVLEYGFSTFYHLNKMGADVQIHNEKYTAYCGRMFLDDLTRSLYNHFKSKVKLRLKYKYAQETYNGMYYFGLTDEEWMSYQSQINTKKPKKIKFDQLKLYKIKEECFLEKSKTHFFILYYPIDVGYRFVKDVVDHKNIKYFAYRDNTNQIIEF